MVEGLCACTQLLTCPPAHHPSAADTRFGTSFIMLERMQEMKDDLQVGAVGLLKWGTSPV